MDAANRTQVGSDGKDKSAVTRRLDLDAGLAAKADFVSVDRFLLPGVSVVLNLDGTHLPFRDDTFDLRENVAHVRLEPEKPEDVSEI
jgi:hypothetical protein